MKIPLWCADFSRLQFLIFYNYFAQSAGAVEYTDCFSAEGKTHQRVSWIRH